MKRKYNGIIIGTGTAGYTAAIRLTKAGKKTAVIDKMPYGGTCALRGCQAKKYLVAAAEAIERGEALVGLGLASSSAMV
jgi:glutathione reductase (NADPH)